MKKLAFIAILGLLLTGCDDLFDKGDAEAVYDGPDVVEFAPLQSEVVAGATRTIKVQLISSEGLASSDLSIAFSVDGGSTAVEGTHFNVVTPSPVTISAGTAATDVVIETIAGSAPNRVRLTLNLEGGSGVQASPNLATHNMFIQD